MSTQEKELLETNNEIRNYAGHLILAGTILKSLYTYFNGKKQSYIQAAIVYTKRSEEFKDWFYKLQKDSLNNKEPSFDEIYLQLKEYEKTDPKYKELVGKAKRGLIKQTVIEACIGASASIFIPAVINYLPIPKKEEDAITA